MSSKVLFVAGVLIVLLLGGLAWGGFMQSYEFHGSVLQVPKLEGNIVLRSAAGPVQLSEQRGKVVLMYFGYTSCPDVCPTSLATLKAALSQLSPEERAQVQVIFVSVDPARDTPERLQQYAHVFGSDFIGASGTQDEIDLITESFGVYYKINTPDADGNYTVDHSSFVYVIDRQGYLVMNWTHDSQPDEISADLSYLLEHDIPISAQLLAGPTQTPVVCSLTLIPEHVQSGEWLYERNCTQCHGSELAGNPAWQMELEDGSHLPPPLNSTGSAWKYSEQELTEIIKEGRNLDNPIHMPAFKEKLSDWEIHYILEYVASSWDVSQQNYHAGFLTTTPQPTWGPIPIETGTPMP
ncbi:MAG TPA: SCO family protein [Anaerolineales bacterium]|nr:SCO family protein [Anaerolineales bacterium]